MRDTAKIFQNGRSQAVRLPAKFRFDAKEVFIRQDERTGDVILSTRPDDWSDLLDMIAQNDVPEDFLDEQDRNQGQQTRDPFSDNIP